MAAKHKTNVKLWVLCSLALLCIFIAFEPGLGGKFRPLREGFANSLRHSEGQMPIAIVLEFVFGATIIFGIPSAALGWVLHAIGIVVWSRRAQDDIPGKVPPSSC